MLPSALVLDRGIHGRRIELREKQSVRGSSAHNGEVALEASASGGPLQSMADRRHKGAKLPALDC
jgi:hypothetical protein